MNSIPTIPPMCQPVTRSTGTKTILIVDDFEPLNDLVARHLSASGYHVLRAYNGLEARELAAKYETIDLLLTDLNMPGLRGDELAVWFTTEHPGIPIMLMSCQPISFAAVRNVRFLPKPFTLGELGSAVRAALTPIALPRSESSMAA